MKGILFTVVFALASQAPTGTIRGVVRDPGGGEVAGVVIVAENEALGLFTRAVTSEQGYYRMSVPPGVYTVRMDGFQPSVTGVDVQAGTTADTNIQLVTGTSITVEYTSPQIRLDSPTLGDSITRAEFEDLPINGRNPLALAKTQAAVQPLVVATNNRIFVPILGAPGGNSGRGTRVTSDGGSIMSIGNGGSAMGFSQEAISEFRISTVNPELSAGLTVAGVIDLFTRRGTNDAQGSLFYFLRDNNFAAHPAISRDAANPDPSFQRRQFGATLGAPIQRNRFFAFGSWERSEQRGVAATTLKDPDFANFSRITKTSNFGNLIDLRVDRASPTHAVFLRYAEDRSRSFAPGPLQLNAYPSSWPRQSGLASQSVLGITSVFNARLVNDLHVSYFFSRSSQSPALTEDCPGCVGVGAPSINIAQSGLIIGAFSGTSVVDGRRFQFHDSTTWMHGSHRTKLGVDWEHNRGGTLNWPHEPATINLYSPGQARQAGIPTPADFPTLENILRLPLRSVSVGLGDPRVPQADGGRVRNWNTVRAYTHDEWRVRPRFTLNLGVAWSVEGNLNHDLAKPAMLARIFGEGGLGPTRKDWNNFSAATGFVWQLPADKTTAVRLGTGYFYDFLFPANLDAERAMLASPGLGRQEIPGTSILSPVPGIPGVPLGTPLDFRQPKPFTGADFLSALSQIQDTIRQDLANADHSVAQIQITKATGGSSGLSVSNPRTPSAFHFNTGVSREVTSRLAIDADFVYRRFTHFPIGTVDLNHFRSARGPEIPSCLPSEKNNPSIACTNGAIGVRQWVGEASYKALLVTVKQRLSRGFQIKGSWALSRNTGTSDSTANGFNLDNWHQNTGPLATDFTHILNVSGVAAMPLHLKAGFNFSYSSAPPFSAYVEGIDFNGDGTTSDLLPGSTVNAFNRGMDKTDLRRLVRHFNETSLGKRDELGTPIPQLALPEHYSFADNFHSLDLRISRSFVLRERWNFTLIGEVFNIYNAANLSGHSGNLANVATFGQPTARSSQIFGSGGPRAFQFAARLTL